MKADEIINRINSNQDEIIKSLKQESIDVYLFLSSQANSKTRISENYLFQFVYRSFYGMNRAGLTVKFYEEYFKAIDKYSKRPEIFHLEKVLEDFSKFNSIYRNKEEKKSMQFSFITKLYHTIDPSKPIYDKYICKTFNISQYYISDETKKLKNLLEAYDKIENLYLSVCRNSALAEIIDEFDKKFKAPKISQTMKFDFIFWQAGKLLAAKENKGTDKIV